MAQVSPGVLSFPRDQRCTSTLGSRRTHYVAKLPHRACSHRVHPDPWESQDSL